jgi:hypothetical protein
VPSLTLVAPPSKPRKTKSHLGASAGKVTWAEQLNNRNCTRAGGNNPRSSTSRSVRKIVVRIIETAFADDGLDRCAVRGAIEAVGQTGIVNLSSRGMLVVSVAWRLGSGNSFARLLCCPAQAERGRKKALRVR